MIIDIVAKAETRDRGQEFLDDCGTPNMQITSIDDGWTVTNSAGEIVPGWHFNMRLYGEDASSVSRTMHDLAVRYGVTLIDPGTIKTRSNEWA